MRRASKKRANLVRAGGKRSVIALAAGLSLVGSAWGGLTAATSMNCRGEVATQVETLAAQNGPKGSSAMDS